MLFVRHSLISLSSSPPCKRLGYSASQGLSQPVAVELHQHGIINAIVAEGARNRVQIDAVAVRRQLRAAIKDGSANRP